MFEDLIPPLQTVPNKVKILSPNIFCIKDVKRSICVDLLWQEASNRSYTASLNLQHELNT